MGGGALRCIAVAQYLGTTIIRCVSVRMHRVDLSARCMPVRRIDVLNPTPKEAGDGAAGGGSWNCVMVSLAAAIDCTAAASNICTAISIAESKTCISQRPG